MYSIEEMNLRQKDKLLKSIVREYQKAQLQLKIIEEKEFYPQIKYNVVKDFQAPYNQLETSMIHYIEKKENLETVVAFIEGIFASLPKEVYRLIEYDYLNPTKREWWREYYSRSTYYRFRKKTLDDVLFYLIK